MTTNPSPQAPDSQTNGSGPDDPFLSLHTAVVLLAAVVIGLVAGCLTALTEVPTATAVLTGLAAGGASVSVLRSLIR